MISCLQSALSHQGQIKKFSEGGLNDWHNIYNWRGIEETGSLGDYRDPFGKFEAEGLTSAEMMIFNQKHVSKCLAKSKN